MNYILQEICFLRTLRPSTFAANRGWLFAATIARRRKTALKTRWRIRVISKQWLAVIGLIGSMTGVLTACPASADEYPSHPVTMIVPYPAGGPTDIISRVVSNIMSKQLGQPIVIESVSGASGTIGAARVGRAAPDGY